MKLSVVVPCYNEVKNIPLMLKRFQEVIKREDIEVVIVDNGSDDGSWQVLDRAVSCYSFARAIRIKENQGYGYGVMQGLKQCTGEFVGWTHADLQTDPGDLIKALNIIEANNNDNSLFVKGNRKGRPIFDQIFTIGMSIFETLYLRVNLCDINAQPNVFSRKFLLEWENPPKDFALDLYALYMARKLGLRIKRFEVTFPKRIHGSSHWNTDIASKWRFIKRTVGYSRKLKKEIS